MRISLPITWAPWVAVLAGLVLLAIGLWQVMDAWEASSWPTTSGTVIESRVATHRSGRSTSHHASIHYRYNAGGIDECSTSSCPCCWAAEKTRTRC